VLRRLAERDPEWMDERPGLALIGLQG